LATTLRQVSQHALTRIEDQFTRVFGKGCNPFFHLGALTIYFFWIVLISGIYLFAFFETSVFGAFQSVERLTHDQWWLGGVMRSLHRYASDAAVVTMMLHLIREFVRDRYRGVRWYSWFTGVPLLWMVFLLGITGYWLVWDMLAQYIALLSAEYMDWLPIFTDPIARNFISQEALSDRFFTLMGFLHLIGIPLFLVFGIWFHVMRIAMPNINPPRPLMAGTLAALLVLSLVKPAVSHEIADLAAVPQELSLDWFYLFIYPVIDLIGVGPVWLLLTVLTFLLMAFPWLPRKKPEPTAKIDLEHCSGCTWCANDCPYGALTMRPRSDGRAHKQEVVIDPDLCVSCGICAGSCPSATPFRKSEDLGTGIEMPQFSFRRLRDETDAALASARGGARVIVYGCDHAAEVKRLSEQGIAAVSMPCTGMLPPSLIDYALRDGRADGVVVTGCCEGDCQHRLGNTWMEQRLTGERPPQLRGRVDRDRLRVHWASVTDLAGLTQEIESFGEALGSLGKTSAGAADGAPAQQGEEART
jgi:coenzyme F420-reducing hydrogenase delta subunit/quinol-cytochrome oxidoreductase complex cytochrome b subunit/NAD-dependent dihydropyrimidine dehydrogenase PreA subunit